ncbi:Spc98 family-domain-containing protein [Rhypophila decipiens]|uniref:Spindle pole body component n=1 Tax=Rhypophila decipiens TaxID=261697 RepID=A0AAN6Y5E3_9PEZI|nr:Spc98 family-domain-containing protein [Rhypophila decipiens]
MANDDARMADLFTIPDFSQPSDSLNQALLDLHKRNPLFALDVSHISTPHSLLPNVDSVTKLQGPDPHVLLPEGISPDGFFRLPDIPKDLVVQQPRSDDTKQSEKTSTDTGQNLAVPEDDVWLLSDHGLVKRPAYMTWEKFTQPDGRDHTTVFITEAGPSVFDALEAQNQIQQGTEPAILADSIYCACLLNLALGRGSVLFSWDDENKAFTKTAPHVKTSGVSVQLMQSIDKLCLGCANAIRYLQRFVQRTFSNPSTPTRVALAGVIDRLVVTVLSELGARGRLARSILQLSSLVRPVQLMLASFQGLVEALLQQRSEEGILSRLFQEVQTSDYKDSLVREAVAEVLRLTSRPWTDFVEEWIGLKPEHGTPVSKAGTGKAFIKVADRLWIDDVGFELEGPDYFLDEDKIPSFLGADVAQTIFETGRNLRFLREHHPENPLSRQDLIDSVGPPKLEWQFDWDSIQNLERRVNRYRDALSLAVERGAPTKASFGTPSTSEEPAGRQLEFFGRSDEQIAQTILASMDRLDQPLQPPTSPAPDPVATLLRARLYKDTTARTENDSFSPHWSLVPLLSFGPIITAQSAVVHRECMRLLFSAHGLRIHLDLLKQCYLMGNGLLCSRLSHALFDADLETAERKAGVALAGGVMGLRLGGGRENWPPASSELRLALMGVLSDSYRHPGTRGPQHIPPHSITTTSSAPAASASRISDSDLPGELSFAVRDLAPEEIDRCMDPDALEALDFLRLSYKPPVTLRTVISPIVLAKYDRIFGFLLRLLRMLYIVDQQFFRGSMLEDNSTAAFIRFRIESRHFVNQLAGYVFGMGITTPWAVFENWLDNVEADLGGTYSRNSSSKGGKRGGHIFSPDRLQKRQEEVLDEIMSALLLRKRQGPVLRLLEDIFGVILRFSKLLRRGGIGPTRSSTEGKDAVHQDGERETFQDLYGIFRKKVELFVAVCKGLAEKKAGSSTTGAEKTKTSSGVRDEDDWDQRRGRDELAGNPIEALVLALDMGGYYAKKS